MIKHNKGRPFGRRAWVRFHYERFLSLRGVAIFVNLLLMFLITFALLYTLHLCFYDSAWDEALDEYPLAWHVFLEMLSPARISGLHSPPWSLLFLSLLTTFIGVGFYSLLIAYSSTKTQAILEVFRSGSGPVIESGHTLILGFDNRVKQLIEELNLSNLSRQALPVVIMSQKTKSEMDLAISREVDRCKQVRINTACGDPSRIEDLKRINAVAARSAVILARCSYATSHELKEDSDVRVIQTVKALYSLQTPGERFPIVAEIFNSRRREMIDSISDYVVTFDGKELLASILVQSAIFEGVGEVYNELFSFNRSEFYLYSKVPPGTCFGDLIYHFIDGVPVGVLTATEEIIIAPEPDYVLSAHEKLLMVATDDDYIKFQESSLCDIPEYCMISEIERPQAQSLLILGWHYLAPAILAECQTRLPSGSQVTIAISEEICDPLSVIDRLPQDRDVTFTWNRTDPFIFREIERIDPFQYDTIILLSRGGQAESEDQMDADTLMLVMLLRRLRDQQIGRSIQSKVITQLFRPENEALIDQGDPDYDDPVHSIFTSRISTMLFTQLSEEGDMNYLYHRLFIEQSHEIALCSIERYIPQLEDKNFLEVYLSARALGEICLGFRFSTRAEGHKESDLYDRGLWLNPPKQQMFHFQDRDQVVVLRPRDLERTSR